MKKTSPKIKKKYGRPTVISRQVLSELKIAFCVDCTDKEACDLAGISEKTLYNYQKKNPDFLQQKQQWKSEVAFKAREQLCKAIENDGRLAFRYLVRKCPQEFGSPSIQARYENNDSFGLEEVIERVKNMYENSMDTRA